MKKNKQSLKVRKQLFQAWLEEGLEKFDLFMDLRIQYTYKKIEPVILIDDMEKIRVTKEVGKNVKTKKTDGKPVKRPEKKYQKS